MVLTAQSSRAASHLIPNKPFSPEERADPLAYLQSPAGCRPQQTAHTHRQTESFPKGPIHLLSANLSVPFPAPFCPQPATYWPHLSPILICPHPGTACYFLTHHHWLGDHPAQRSHSDAPTLQDDALTFDRGDLGFLGPGREVVRRLIPKLERSQTKMMVIPSRPPLLYLLSEGRGRGGHLVLHAGSPWYRDFHVDVLKEVAANLVLLGHAFDRRLHPATGGRRRGVGRVGGPRRHTVQPVGASSAGVVSLVLLVTGQDNWRRSD